MSTNLPSLSETPHFSHCRVTVTNPLPFSLTACACVRVCMSYVGIVSACARLFMLIHTKKKMVCVFSLNGSMFSFLSHSYTLKRVVEGLPAELPWLLM